MSWNYRILRFTDSVLEDSYSIHEVYYDERGSAIAYKESPSVVADAVQDLEGEIRRLFDALKKPMLEESDFYKEEVPDKEEFSIKLPKIFKKFFTKD